MLTLPWMSCVQFHGSNARLSGSAINVRMMLLSVPRGMGGVAYCVKSPIIRGTRSARVSFSHNAGLCRRNTGRRENEFMASTRKPGVSGRRGEAMRWRKVSR